jgi:hypothetical protein
MTATSNRPLRFESIAAIRIGVRPTGEKHDQYVVCTTPRVSRTTTFCEVSTISKLGLYCRDEILVPNDRLTQPSSWATSFSLHKPP